MLVTLTCIKALTCCLWLGFCVISQCVHYRGLDSYNFRPDFMSFCHRGHAIPLAVEEPAATAASSGGKRQESARLKKAL